MKARPIIFKTPMIQALLDGKKTQRREVIKPQPWVDANRNARWKDNNFGQNFHGVPYFRTLASSIPSSRTKRVYCPFGQVGDLLWVREKFTYGFELDKNGHKICVDDEGNDLDLKIWYADSDDFQWTDDDGYPCNTPWKPSIHMPRTLSRLTLEITDIRVEKLQDISDADAIAEAYVSKWFEKVMR